MSQHQLTNAAHGAADPAQPDRPSGTRRRRTVLLLGSCAALLAAATVALAASSAAPLSVPTITAHPADPTNQTSAHFTYSDPQAGVAYQCQLDGASYSACPAGGVTYPGLLAQGDHAFRVRATSGTKTSSSATFSWTVDTTPPSATIAFPFDGDTLNANSWVAGCSRHGAICGRVRDASGVHAVVISIQNGSGKWWGGASFNQSSEAFLPATLSSPDSGTSDWGYPLALPADGNYTIHVRATDDAGNTTPAGAQAVAHFTIDTTPPLAPSIGSGPESTTTSKTASFAFTDAAHGVSFACTLDGARPTPCTSPKSYGSIALGSHTFRVTASDPVGNVSAATAYSWTVAKTVETSGKLFTVSGNASGSLAPGVTRTLAVTVTNPNGVPIVVTSLTTSVAAGSTNPGCDGPTNLELTQSNLSSTNTLTVPANGQVSLPNGSVSAPQVLMKDLPTNQDACKNASFTFNYSGSAHS